MAGTYSDLHQNIQDCFNEAGVEIMSPHYAQLRDGNQTTIPEAHELHQDFFPDHFRHLAHQDLYGHLDVAKEQLSGKGLARHRFLSSARFQHLPVRTAREVFPQAAHPVGFFVWVIATGSNGLEGMPFSFRPLYFLTHLRFLLLNEVLYCTVFLYHLNRRIIMLKTTYTNARANFAGLCDEVTKNREIVIIGRRSGESVAMISADELESLIETAHLMRSPKNAQRLLTSLERALKRQGEPSTSEKLQKELGLEK